jgi:hypothetical protein
MEQNIVHMTCCDNHYANIAASAAEHPLTVNGTQLCWGKRPAPATKWQAFIELKDDDFLSPVIEEPQKGTIGQAFETPRFASELLVEHLDNSDSYFADDLLNEWERLVGSECEGLDVMAKRGFTASGLRRVAVAVGPIVVGIEEVL